MFVSFYPARARAERHAAHAAAIEVMNLAVMFELGARPHPPAIYGYAQSDVFVPHLVQQLRVGRPGEDIWA